MFIVCTVHFIRLFGKNQSKTNKHIHTWRETEKERDKNTTEKDYARTRKFDKTNSTFEYALNSLKTNIDLGGKEEKKHSTMCFWCQIHLEKNWFRHFCEGVRVYFSFFSRGRMKRCFEVCKYRYLRNNQNGEVKKRGNINKYQMQFRFDKSFLQIVPGWLSTKSQSLSGEIAFCVGTTFQSFDKITTNGYTI